VSAIEGFAVSANMLIIGGVGGFFVGFLLKRTVKILLIGLGIIAFLLASLAFVGSINVNYDGLAVGIGNLFNAQQISMMLQAFASYLPMLAGFAVGFLLGIGRQ